jgi:hypothetical protein
MTPIVDEAGTVVGVASTSRLMAAGSRPSTDMQVPQEDRERLRAQLE